MKRSMPRPTSRSLLTLSTLIAASGGLAPAVLGQAQDSGIMIMERDDGGGRSVAFFAMPDFQSLREPDFLRRDLPLFENKLTLDELQSTIVARLLDAYMEDFKRLMEDMLPPEPRPMKFALGGPADADAEPVEGVAIAVSPEDDPMAGLDEDLAELAEMEGEGPHSIELSIGMTSEGPGGGWSGSMEGEAPEGGDGDEAGATSSGAPGEPSVTVAISGPDGEPLPEEVRKKLEERAKQMAEQIRKQMEEQAAQQAANGGEPGEIQVGFGPMGGQSIEELQARQAEMAEAAEKFSAAKAELKRQFINDVTAQLAPPQAAHWPDLDRALTRERTLPKSRLDGESLNLLKVADEIAIDDGGRAAIAEELHRYELDLHQALVARNEYVTDAQNRVDEAMQKGDYEKALSIVDRATALRLGVRGVNERYMDSLATLLPAPAASEFKTTALRKAFPRAYGTTRAQQTFDKMLALDSLTPERRADIERLRASYLAELEVVNHEVQSAILKHQPAESRRMIEHTRDMTRGEVDPHDPFAEDPIRAVTRKRREIGNRYLSSAYAMLDEQQIAQLPAPPSKQSSEPVIIQLGGPAPR